MGPKIQNGYFLETAPTILIKFQQFVGTIFINKTAEAVSSGK
jgi:hypothetical protein